MFELGPNINGLVTDGNTKLCCRGYVFIGSEHAQDYKRLLPVCEAKILRVTVKRIEKELKFSHLFMLISDDCWLKVPKN